MHLLNLSLLALTTRKIFLTHFAAFDASGGELLLVAARAVDLLLPGDETFGADGRLAHHATEAPLVPLPALVLHLLVT